MTANLLECWTITSSCRHMIPPNSVPDKTCDVSHMNFGVPKWTSAHAQDGILYEWLILIVFTYLRNIPKFLDFPPVYHDCWNISMNTNWERKSTLTPSLSERTTNEIKYVIPRSIQSCTVKLFHFLIGFNSAKINPRKFNFLHCMPRK